MGIEDIAIALGVLNILLLVRRSVWNYAFGIAMVLLYARIFYDARLYSDALLQGFFLVVQVYGWANWVRGRRDDGDIVVERLSRAGWVRWAAVVVPAWALWSFAMHRWTDAAYPFWDGAIAALSVAAQTMLARRLIENWLLWIAVDVIAIAVYAARDLERTSLLYVLFLTMSAWGWVAWRRAERAQAGVPA